MIQFDILSVTVEILKCLKKSKKPDRKDWIKNVETIQGLRLHP